MTAPAASCATSRSSVSSAATSSRAWGRRRRGVNANDAILTVPLHHERLVRRYGSGLAGLILSCKRVGGPAPDASSSPPATCPSSLNYDTAGVVRRIRMIVKIQPHDEAKKAHRPRLPGAPQLCRSCAARRQNSAVGAIIAAMFLRALHA